MVGLITSLLLSNVTFACNSNSCSPNSEPTKGFNVKWFSYELNDCETYKDEEYMCSGYLEKTPYHSKCGVNTVNFKTGFPCNYNQENDEENFICECGCSGENTGWTCPCAPSTVSDDHTCYNSQKEVFNASYVYEYETSVTNFTMELTGYFKAPEAGSFTFNLGETDGSTAVFFGKNAFQCCSQDEVSVENPEIFLNGIKDHENSCNEKSIELDEGLYYPIRITFANAYAYSSLVFSATLPCGKVIQDFTEYIFTFEQEDEHCPASTTSSIFTSGISASSSILTTPTIDSTTTTTNGWTGSYVSTYSTKVSVSTDRKSTRLNSSH
ncbi:uncharacterized protein SCODWIG_04002 [Saccharomycodes ludwigii]|uniref:PA14 domain-containing protein n=1 Tax=Saccharomycodes ludwigii TaxID=36035 RepID=A0A376BCA7_9ASCO|nr:uncharacterized protein SCODWIG_04002 [Saccharomycodes ludwigii]